MKCRECRKADLVVTRENHRYTESGLPHVTLEGVSVRACPACGFRTVVIPRIEELHQVLAYALVEYSPKFAGPEIRYLRKYLGYNRELFANVIGVDPDTVSHWEAGRRPMGTSADHLLRVLVMRTSPIEEYPNEKLAEVGRAEDKGRLLRMRSAPSGWAVEAEA